MGCNAAVMTVAIPCAVVDITSSGYAQALRMLQILLMALSCLCRDMPSDMIKGSLVYCAKHVYIKQLLQVLQSVRPTAAPNLLMIGDCL